MRYYLDILFKWAVILYIFFLAVSGAEYNNNRTYCVLRKYPDAFKVSGHWLCRAGNQMIPVEWMQRLEEEMHVIPQGPSS